MQYKVILLLGSNLGDAKKNVEKAIQIIDKQIGKILKISDFLFSDPVEFVSSNIFCNIALSLQTELSPIALLNSIKTIEQQMGRNKDSAVCGAYQDRIIDIDIVHFEGIHFECKKLSIPHIKHTQERAFSKKLLENFR